MKLYLILPTLVACCAAQNSQIQFRSGFQQRQQRPFRQRQRPQFQPQPQGELTDVRIGLLGEDAGLDPVPGSDYPSRIVNNNPSQNYQNQNNQQGTYQPPYQPVIAATNQQTNQNLQQGNVYTGGQSQGRTPKRDACYCSNKGECPHNGGFDGAGLLDIRIVNTRPTIVNGQLQCNNYQEVCCPPDAGGSNTGGNTGGNSGSNNYCPAAQPRGCGQRTFIPVPGYSVQPPETQFGAYPWVATILREGDAYVSSGVLIDSQWVLTVAHHVQKYSNNYSGLKVRLGEWDASDPDHEPCRHEERTVSQLIIHQQFSMSNLTNDVALLRLSSPVDSYSYPHINTACLPNQYEQFDGQTCWTAGFGKDAFGQQGEYSFIQKEVDLPVVSHYDCQNSLQRSRLGSNFQLNSRAFICAGGVQGNDACEGDGGAPLVCERGGSWTVVGLVAWGVGCAEANRPGVYVNVASYVDWIRGYTQYNG